MLYSRSLVSVLVSVFLLTGCQFWAAPPPAPAPPAPASPGASDPASPAASSPAPEPGRSYGPGDGKRVLVYFVVEAGGGPKLVREPRWVNPQTPARGAVEAMLSGPEDPDYASAWATDARVRGINHRDHVITVDLSKEAARANVGGAYENAMVQQLMWTVTDILEPEASVAVWIEGKPAGGVWGHIHWDKPVKRESADQIRNHVSIDSVAEGELLTSPVKLAGEAAAFEGVLTWTLTSDDAGVKRSGEARATHGQRFSPWEVKLDLVPGTYTFTITEELGGQGTPDSDSRTFQVVSG